MAATASARATPAETITALILDKLTQGVKPWRKTWAGGVPSRPLRANGIGYTGINCLYLWAVAEDKGYASPYWMTYNQASEFGAQVRKGEKASLAIFYKVIGGESETSCGDSAGGDSSQSGQARRVSKSFHVFNADQIDGLPERFITPDPQPLLPASEERARLEAYFSALPFVVVHGGHQPCYRPSLDIIEMPPPERFESYLAYAATRLHETGHATGAKHRLARDFSGRFGSEAYSFEELVAELFSCLMSAELGLPDTEMDNHAAYIGNWITILQNDPKAIMTAAARAEEAVSYIHTLIAASPEVLALAA